MCRSRLLRVDGIWLAGEQQTGAVGMAMLLEIPQVLAAIFALRSLVLRRQLQTLLRICLVNLMAPGFLIAMLAGYLATAMEMQSRLLPIWHSRQ